MKRLLQLVAVLLVCCVPTFAQSNGSYHDVAWRFHQGFPTYPAPGATVTVCNFPAVNAQIPCVNRAVIYGGPSTATLMANPITADQNGNYSFWAAPGNYVITITGGNIPPYALTITVGCGGGFGCSGALNRLQTVAGTQLTSGDFTFSGWGTGATISNISGTDTAFTFTMTAGVTPSIDPTVKLTFHDGPWTIISSTSQQMVSSTGEFSDISSANNLSSVTLTYLNLPVATKTYTISVIVTGSSNIIPAQAALGVNPALLQSTNLFTGVNTFADGIVSAGTPADLAGSGACVTITSKIGGSWTGQFTCTGASGLGTVVITPGTVAPNGWNCFANDETADMTIPQSAHTTVSCTVRGTVSTNDVLIFTAVAY